MKKIIKSLITTVGISGSSILLTGCETAEEKQAKEIMAKKGFDPAMGARPIGRKIQEIVSFSLAEELLFGKLQYGGSLEIDFKDGKAEFKVTHSKRKPREKEVVEE